MTSLFRLGLLMLLCLLGIAAAILAWGLSNEVIRYTSEGPKLEFPIIAVGEQSVTLPILAKPNRFADTLKEGRFTLVYDGGYGRLGAIVDERPDAVVRAFDLLANHTRTTVLCRRRRRSRTWEKTNSRNSPKSRT